MRPPPWTGQGFQLWDGRPTDLGVPGAPRRRRRRPLDSARDRTAGLDAPSACRGLVRGRPRSVAGSAEAHRAARWGACLPALAAATLAFAHGLGAREHTRRAERNVTWFAPEDVLLVVEVVSPESAHRDNTVKPGKYAAAGIPHYWLIEEHELKPVVHVYELDKVTSSYLPVGIFRDQLSRPVPFPITLDLTNLVRMR
ncbi:Uma2 family endonuclease [Crossiella cryophila]|nr:Uma2 family endonuclease [Crossiella cryophila]